MTTTVHTSRKIWTKQDLRLHYDEVLEAGLTTDQLSHFRRHGRFGDDIILQSSSGSSGQQPLLIPRGRKDIIDIVARMTRAHRQMWGAPARIALLGGISHVEGALKLKMDGAEVRAFELSDVDELIAFAPDYLSCYPSIARVLIARHAQSFPQLKTIKLGGERVLPSDVDKIFAAFPDILVTEQLGSTELPAVAVGAYCQGEPRRLQLQTDRYDFLLADTAHWQPLIVRDRFSARLFPVGPFYDSGDEVKMEGDHIVEVRRRDDRANAFADEANDLLQEGCINVQIDEGARIVYFDGVIARTTTQLQGVDYQMVAAPLQRLPQSNKLPLLIKTLPSRSTENGES